MHGGKILGCFFCGPFTSTCLTNFLQDIWESGTFGGVEFSLSNLSIPDGKWSKIPYCLTSDSERRVAIEVHQHEDSLPLEIDECLYKHRNDTTFWCSRSDDPRWRLTFVGLYFGIRSYAEKRWLGILNVGIYYLVSQCPFGWPLEPDKNHKFSVNPTEAILCC